MKTCLLVLLAIATAVPLRSSLWAQAAPSQKKSASSVDVDIVGCVDRKGDTFELTNVFFYVLYNLTGQTAGLENHIGDEVRVRGIEVPSPASATPPPSGEQRRPPTLQVTSVDLMMHKNPEGVRPVLGNPDTWVKHENPEYGVGVRYPPTFQDATSQFPWPSNFAGQAPSSGNSIVTVSIPRTTYPDSNFGDGDFAVFVSPSIRSEGTCKQFSKFPEYAGSINFDGISYSRTVDGGGAAGTAGSVYYFHTFQNDLCYEFAFYFSGLDGTGIDVPCEMQWVSEDNELELIRGVLSTVSFATPKLKVTRPEVPAHKVVPSVMSFEHGPVLQKPVGRGSVNTVAISWKTNADYVQIRYPCAKFLSASTEGQAEYGRLGTCGENTDTNLPANGSMSLLLLNYNPAPVDFVLTIVPFTDGVGHPKDSKTASISAPVSPHAPLPQDKEQPAPHK